jgi:hypothetical protein
MKFNKWTMGLAALGVVSLASVAKAEEKASSVMTALSATTLSGYVDTSAQWNVGTGQRLPEYKFGGPSKADGFNLDVIQLRIEKPLDEAEWAAGYRVDLWAGPDANVLGTQSIFSSNGNGKAATGDFAVRQAYVALRAPVGNGLDFKVGVFDSIIGYESVESGNNPNYTRSYGHSIEPQTHTGVLASYRFSDMLSATFGVADTIGPSINERAQGPNGGTVAGLANWTKAESYKTYMGSIAVTAPESMGFLSGSTLYGGIVNGFSDSYGDGQTSYYVGSTVATPVTGLRCGASFDYLDIHNISGETWSVAGYASYQATEKLSLHLRGEYLKDRGEQKFFTTDFTDPLASTNPNKVLAVTATAQYDLWKNVISRVEFRWDHSLSGQATWGVDNTTSASDPGTLKNQYMLAANIIYKF